MNKCRAQRRLVVTKAVDQLAEGAAGRSRRRTDEQIAARVELRDEFDSGPMLAMVIALSSGYASQFSARLGRANRSPME